MVRRFTLIATAFATPVAAQRLNYPTSALPACRMASRTSPPAKTTCRKSSFIKLYFRSE
jgi:hypothetical protein